MLYRMAAALSNQRLPRNWVVPRCMFAIGRTAMSKKYLSVAFAYVGVIVGAGLASGQDLLQYFLSFGATGLIGIAALGVLNVIFGVVALQLGSYFRSGHHDEVFERITHPAVRRVIDVVLVFSGFAMGFVMLAGAGANLEQQFGLPAWAGSAVCAGLVILTAFLDFDRIMKVIGVFTPMIVIAIVVLVIYSLVTPHPSVAELNATATQVTPALPNLWFSAINYFALCVVNGIGMAFVLGGSVLRIREARLAGRIGGAIIALVIGGDALALYLNMDRIWDVNVPALEIARMIHPAFAFVYTLIIFALIYNTVFSLFFATARRFSGGVDKAHAHRPHGRCRAGVCGLADGLQEADRRHVSDHRLARRRAPGGPGCGLVARARGRLARGEAAPQAHSPPGPQARRSPGVHGRASRKGPGALPSVGCGLQAAAPRRQQARQGYCRSQAQRLALRPGYAGCG